MNVAKRTCLRRLSGALVLPVALLSQACVGSVGPVDEGEDRGERAAPEAGEPSEPERASEPKDSAAPEEGEGEGEGEGAAAQGPVDHGRPCEQITDDELFAAVYGGPKVPPGYYVDAPEEGAWAMWGSGCADHLDVATEEAALAADASAGWLTGASRTTRFFHEVDIGISGGYTMHYRKTRCDYFDGAKIGGEVSAEALRVLAMYLWYSVWSITGGYNALGGLHAESGGAHAFTLCEARTTFGDCGLCDDIALLRSTYTLAPDGTVSLPDGPELIRVVKGKCD